MNEIQYTKWILGLSNQIRRIFNLSTNNTGAQTRVLCFVLDNYLDRDIYQKDIQKALNIGGSTISVLLKKMENNGMIKRKRVAEDDRLKKIVPTSRTIMMKEKLNQDIQNIEKKLLSEIPEEELATYLKVTKKNDIKHYGIGGCVDMEKNATISNPLGTERIGKLIVRYAIPTIISNVVNSLYNMVDQIFIGNGVGYLGNAATNIILPLMTLVMALGMMIGDGTAAYMSLNLGKGKPDKAAKGVGNAITLAVGVGIVFAILIEIFLNPLCHLFGATTDNLPYALEYGRIVALGFPFAIICSSFGSIIRADGRPKESMIGLLIGCITNIILDPIFIFVCKWGVAGAAFATIIGQLLNAIFYIFCMFRFKFIKLKKEYFPLKWDTCKSVLGLGTSSFITQGSTVLVITVLNNALGTYGALSKYGADIPLAALGITMKVNQLVSGVAVGIAAGVQPILGYNFGSGQYSRVKKSFKWSLTAGTMILVIAFVVFQVFPEQIVLLFGQESDLYMEFAVKCFRTYLGGCFLIPAGAVTGILFQAIGKTVHAAILSLSRQVIILIPAVLIFGMLGGVEGILWSGAVSDCLSGIISLITVGICWKGIFRKDGEKNE